MNSFALLGLETEDLLYCTSTFTSRFKMNSHDSPLASFPDLSRFLRAFSTRETRTQTGRQAVLSTAPLPCSACSAVPRASRLVQVKH